MEKKYGEFSMEDVQKLTQSPTGQQLIAMLNTRSAEMNSALVNPARERETKLLHVGFQQPPTLCKCQRVLRFPSTHLLKI